MLKKSQKLQTAAATKVEAYWSLTIEQLLFALHASKNGLQPADAEGRLKQYGLNVISAQKQATAVRLFLSQFKSPLVLILIFTAIVSGVVVVLGYRLFSFWLPTLLGFVAAAYLGGKLPSPKRVIPPRGRPSTRD